MIENEDQYLVTKEQARRFKSAIKKMEEQPDLGVHPVLRRAQLDALKSVLRDLDSQVATYDFVRSELGKGIRDKFKG